MTIKNKLFLATVAVATTFTSINAMANGFVIGGNAGLGQAKDTNISASITGSNLNLSSTIDNKSTFAYKIYIGYDFDVTKNISIEPEVGYQSWLNDSTGNESINNPALNYRINTDVNSLNVLAKIKYKLDNGLNAFIGGGMAYTDTSIGISGGGLTGKGSINLDNTNLNVIKIKQWLPIINVGFGYYVTKNINIVFEYDHLFGDTNLLSASASLKPVNINATGKTPSVNNYMIGVTYKF